jgi:hypothetical protein
MNKNFKLKKKDKAYLFFFKENGEFEVKTSEVFSCYQKQKGEN